MCSDVKHFCVGLLASDILLCQVSVRVFCPFLKLWTLERVLILWIQISCLDYMSVTLTYDLLFVFLTVYFSAEIFNFDEN